MKIPEDWLWEQAKELFLKPDVLPADQVEVRLFHLALLDVAECIGYSLSGRTLTLRG